MNAELPYVVSHPRLHNTIKKFMVLDQCGIFQSQIDILACKMVDGEKGYPKDFQKQIVVGANNIVLYQRGNNNTT